MGRRFLILGSKNKFTSSIFFFLIDKSLATTSVNEKFSENFVMSDESNFLNNHFFPLTEGKFIFKILQHRDLVYWYAYSL